LRFGQTTRRHGDAGTRRKGSPRRRVAAFPRPERRGRPAMSFLQFGPEDLAAIAPEIVLAAGGGLIVLLEAFAPAARRWFATLSLAAIAGSLFFLLRAPAGTSFAGHYDTSALAVAVGLFLGATAAVAVLVAKPYLAR